VWFAGRFERLGRQMAAAPRSFVLGLCALTALLFPGVIRLQLRADAPASESESDGGAALAGGDRVLFELVCDAGLWSSECLETVAALTRVLSEPGSVVRHVESLSSRPRVVAAGGALELQSFVGELPADAAALRRLRARAGEERAVLRGLVAPNERAALVAATLAPGTSARDAHALIESLRARFQRPPSFYFSAVSSAERAHALEQSALRDLLRVTPLALLGLTLLGAAAFASARVGLWLGALAAMSLACAAGALGLAGTGLGTVGAALPLVVGSSAALAGLPLLHRIRSEQRAGAALGLAVTRALASLGAPLAGASLAGALAFVSLAGLARGGLGRLALASACGLGFSALAVLVGLPSALLAARPRAARGQSLLRAGVFGGALESALGKLDGILRARGRRLRGALVALALTAFAAGGLRELRADGAAAHFWPVRTPQGESLASVARDFGGATPVRAVLDSGAPGGAAEPAFLERVLAFEHAANALPAVAHAESLVDTAVMPATRARHDDDPGFFVVPATRGEVEETLALFARESPEALATGLDGTRRFLAVDLLVDGREPGALIQVASALAAAGRASFGRDDAVRLYGDELAAASESAPLAAKTLSGAGIALAVLALVASLVLESAVLGALAALPAALALALVLGAMGRFGLALDSASGALPALISAVAALPALLYLHRVRELARAGAELHVAVSIALRDVGRPIAEGALASLFFLLLTSSALPPIRALGALACAGNLTSTLAVLGVLPVVSRIVRPRPLIARSDLARGETLSCVGSARTRSRE